MWFFLFLYLLNKNMYILKHYKYVMFMKMEIKRNYLTDTDWFDYQFICGFLYENHSVKEFLNKPQYKIVKEFQEGYSAKNFNRPEWQNLYEFAKKNKDKIDYLLLVDWDRFSRNTFEELKVVNDFKELNIEINCINKWINYNSPSDLLMHLIYLGIPEVDNKIRSQKVQMGMR